MRLTARDVQLTRDISLSHLLSRDQILKLGYFNSVPRANSRLLFLRTAGLVRKLESPFHHQFLYVPGKLAHEVVGERISRLTHAKTGGPRFVRHAMSVTNVRIALVTKGEGKWKYEQQLWRKVNLGQVHEVRPDGLYVGQHPVFVEVDLGHVSPAKFREKLLSYQALAHSGQCQSLYQFSDFRVLTVTTGTLRARRLARLLPSDPGFGFVTHTFEELGVAPIESWS